ncbi:MAG: DUF2339 domain-containing protein, partial [Pseudomonadota bacterium]
MESVWVLAGILALTSMVGGLIAFFGWLGKAAAQERLNQRFTALEAKINALQDKLEQPGDLRYDLDDQQQLLRPTPIAAAALADITQHPLQSAVIPASEAIPDGAAKTPDSHELDSTTDTPLSIAEPRTAEDWDSDIQPKPALPSIIEKAFLAAKNWLFGGNTLVRSGIVILFIGISFLLKYAAEHTQVPIEFRMAGIALSGIGLLALGWHLRTRRPEYSWAIQGGGVGVLYLTIFAALKLYQLIPAGPAFFLLIAVAFLSALIAVLQSAMALAVLGFAGGFLAPILTSSGQGSHVGLFSYYLVLNLGIAFVAFHKSWRPLNVLGFAFTFIIGTLWGAKSYTPELFASTEPFLVIHFLLFTLIAVLYAHRQSTKAGDYVDATLVFGTPIVGFSLQYALLRDSHFGLAYSALALAIFYIALAWWLLTRRRDTLQFLGECFLALGIGFATLTLPLALDGRWT